MESRNCYKMFFIVVLTVFTLFGNGESAHVEFYMNYEYTGLLSRVSRSSDACFDFDQVVQNKISSARLVDSCFLLFDQTGCSGNSIKLEEDVPNIAELVETSTHDNFDKKAKSYRFCGAGEGVDDITVDFFDNLGGTGNPVASYENVCKCVSLPASVLVNVSSLDNHHSCVELFTSTNCKNGDEDASLKVFAGRSSVSKDITDTGVYQRLNSFIPCRIPPKCVELNATLFEFELMDAPDDEIRTRSTTTAFSMSAKTTVWNNGSASVTQEYSASRSVRETVEVETVDVSRTVHKWGIEVSLSVGGSINLGILKASASVAIKATYEGMQENERTERRKVTTDVMTAFTAKQLIKIDPCHYYDVESFVTVTENYPVLYKSFFKFQGMSSGERMTAEELQNAVEANNEFVFHEKIDDFTVSAYTTSEIIMSFGVETEIRGNGYKIPGCYSPLC